MGRNSLTVEELKREVKHTTPPSNGNSSVSNIFQILTCNGTVDVNAMSGTRLPCEFTTRGE